MENEELEEWDESFLEQAIRLEEQVLSSSNPTQHRRSPPPPYAVNASCYSPPRELSQRNQEEPIVKVADHFASGRIVTDFVVPVVNAKDQKIDRLKRELGRVSKQLTHLEQECVDLRKERDKKEGKFRPLISRVEAKYPKVHCTKNGKYDFGGEYGMRNHDYSAAAQLGQRDLKTSNHAVGCQINVACKTVGVQTDIAVESTNVIVKDELSTSRQCPKKLLGIWDSTLEQKTGKHLVSKLFLACESDFHDLFGYLNLNSSIKNTVASLGQYPSNASLQRNAQSAHSAEAAKVSNLYYMFTKISNGMVRMEALLEAVVDLCCLENVFIVCRSLHILRIVLSNLLSWERKFDRRDCFVVEKPASGNASSQKIGSICSQKLSSFHWNSGETVFEKKVRDPGSTSTTGVKWISLFELMHQIVMKHPVEHVRLEAVSIMNVIVRRTNAYSERESCGKGVVFQSVSKLLRKEAGFDVQNQAVHLLYLLLNCPKVMSMFCSGYKDEIAGAGSATSDARNGSNFQQFNEILEGLADCVSCFGNNTPGLQFRRNAITLLAFLASSGMCGFEILVNHKLLKRNNFFALILQVVVAENDVEALDCVQPSEIFKERTLLIREALIFLNRLVSNAQYSGPVLRILTNSRDVAFLTVDIANRLSQKGKWLWQSDTMTRQIRESEIVELARVFKKRVFNFLGYSIS